MDSLETVDPEQILFHVGYHKTATTWMQREFFQHHVGFHEVLSHDQVAELITDPLNFDFEAGAVQSVMEAQRDRSGLVNVVSAETLCGHPFYGGREGPLFARRVKAVAPRAKILFTIREQKRAMVSTYMQYIARGGSLSPDEFFGDHTVKHAYYFFNYRHFLYDRLVKQYMDLFGEDRVLVVTTESFVRRPDDVLRSIARFAGADPSAAARARPSRRVGESPVEAVAPVLRRINHFRWGAAKREVVLDLGMLSDGLYRGVHRLGRNPKVKTWLKDRKPVSSVVRERFGGRFGESNRILQRSLGTMLDLAGDGFEMSGSGAASSPAPVAAVGRTSRAREGA
jgi:hypothetical protein